MSEWVAVSLTTGDLISDLPLLEVDSVAASMGRYEIANGSLPIATGKAPPEWLRATKPKASVLILLDDNPLDPAHGIPVWGGMVNRRRRSHKDVLPLDLITIEGYFEQRYVRDKLYTGVAECTILSDLITTYAGAGSNGGIPIRVQQIGSLGQARDREYFSRDDKTLYSAIRDLAAVLNGPEWYVGWEWQYNPDRLTPVAYIGDRVGSAVAVGFAPAAVFDIPGSGTEFELVEDYGVGRGGNEVMATSSGEGETRPQSSPVLYADPERPTFELRFSPSTSITNISTLDDHAAARAAEVRHGVTSVSITANLGTAPRLGVDWGIGDEVGVSLGGIAFDGRDTVPSIPGGAEARGRVAGWKRSLAEPQTITPLIVTETGAFDG